MEKLQIRNRNNHKLLLAQGFNQIQENIFETEIKNVRASDRIEEELAENGLNLSTWLPYGCPENTIVMSTPADQDIECGA